ncbi:MAG: phytanoyl-CoA dioxygenase family protein, partial [Alphaproteobacteria bacterium]
PALAGHHQPALLNCLCDDAILGLSERLGHGPLIGTSYYLNFDTPDMYWHQDTNFLPPSLPAAFDLAAFCATTPFSQIQWNVALSDDACLMIVPGSHRRPMTAGEAAVRGLTDDRAVYHDAMPGRVAVDLRPGDAVVYNNNLLHGVRNPQRRYRRSLHWFWVRDGHYDPYLYPRTVLTPAERAALDPRLVAMSDRSPPSP